jgi:hypothetical protein
LVPTIGVGEELDLLQGVELLLRTAGHAEGGRTRPLLPDIQVTGVHEEHMSEEMDEQKCVSGHRLPLV